MIENIRHSFAHVLALAVQRLYPGVHFGIGPVTDTGFFYDFKFEKETPSEKDLERIEKEMKKIIKESLEFKYEEVSAEKARKQFKGQPFKLELVKDLEKYGTTDWEEIHRKKQEASGRKLEAITLYSIGEFTDLCRGGHVENTGDLPSDAFNLTHIAGAYWRGDEKNSQLTRIYGVAFNTKKELEEHRKLQAEAEKRDHRRLGKELGLFSFSELVGAGLPLWSPKGTVLRNELQTKLLEISKKYDMQPVTIPHIAKRKLYEISGHADKFGDELLLVKSRYDEFVMKPVNCPHHTQIYASQPRSYRDLPIRFMESTMQYRDEKPGEIGGLTRVRSITVDDGHIFCTPDQIKNEAKNVARIIQEFYSALRMFGNHWVSFSVRDPNKLHAYIGDPTDWDKAERMLAEISDELKLNTRRIEGEAAIYGPKLDYIFKDSLGREWQLATIQLDFAMPKRFGLEYTNEKGEKAIPVMIHRAILGSYERFLAILIEHFAGAFPFWLSPVQVAVLPISDKVEKYAQKITGELQEKGIRVWLDNRNESIGKKIREAELQKIPYSLIIGEKEERSGTVSVRERGERDLGGMKLEKFLQRVEKEKPTA